MKKIILLLCLCANVANGQTVKVIDGDTIKVDGQKWRLAGVNCPEKDDVAGDAATAFAKFMVAQGTVHCEQVGNQTSHDRKVGRCYVGNYDLGMAMILHGDCGRCPAFDPDGLYATAQEEGGFDGRFPKYCKVK